MIVNIEEIENRYEPDDGQVYEDVSGLLLYIHKLEVAAKRFVLATENVAEARVKISEALLAF